MAEPYEYWYILMLFPTLSFLALHLHSTSVPLVKGMHAGLCAFPGITAVPFKPAPVDSLLSPSVFLMRTWGVDRKRLQMG